MKIGANLLASFQGVYSLPSHKNINRSPGHKPNTSPPWNSFREASGYPSISEKRRKTERCYNELTGCLLWAKKHHFHYIIRFLFKPIFIELFPGKNWGGGRGFINPMLTLHSSLLFMYSCVYDAVGLKMRSTQKPSWTQHVHMIVVKNNM